MKLDLRQPLLACAMAAAFAAPAVHGQTVFADNFDANPLQLDTTPTGWTIEATASVDLIGASSAPGSDPQLPDPLPGNGVYVDLKGSDGIAGLLSSPLFTLEAGVPYVASFALAGSQVLGQESVQVTFGDVQQVYTLLASAGFRTFSLTFTPTQTAADYAIAFGPVVPRPTGLPAPQVVADPNAFGAYLDHVSVTAVPEPSSLALWMAGLAGVVGIRRLARRRQAAIFSRQ